MSEWIPGLNDRLKKALQQCLDKVHVAPRATTAIGRKSTNRFQRITGNVPEDLGREFLSLPGAISHNMERAFRLFLEAQPEQENEE